MKDIWMKIFSKLKHFTQITIYDVITQIIYW